MPVATLINRSCTLLRRSEGDADDYGNEVATDTPVSTVCEIQQRQRDEDDQMGELSDTLWTVFFLPTETVDTGDGLVVDGETYEMVGEPWVARNPMTQTNSHIEAVMRRTAGPGDSS